MLRVEAGAGIRSSWSLGAVSRGLRKVRRRDPAAARDRHGAAGRWTVALKGFVVEPVAIEGARDISSFGGWRAFMAEKAEV